MLHARNHRKRNLLDVGWCLIGAAGNSISVESAAFGPILSECAAIDFLKAVVSISNNHPEAVLPAKTQIDSERVVRP